MQENARKKNSHVMIGVKVKMTLVSSWPPPERNIATAKRKMLAGRLTVSPVTVYSIVPQFLTPPPSY
jgi:hypothetical protein